MRLFLKRDLSADSNAFTVYDELGCLKYLVASKQPVLKSINLSICDPDGQPVARIRRVPIAGTKTFVLKAYKRRVTLVLL
ncbi:MAG: hypothetical protein II125_01365, partial [Ruminococcus sp.]|nr:hypothetical protein [Ruminococcus sp.]